jgi:hypothetical protein
MAGAAISSEVAAASESSRRPPSASFSLWQRRHVDSISGLISRSKSTAPLAGSNNRQTARPIPAQLAAAVRPESLMNVFNPAPSSELLLAAIWQLSTAVNRLPTCRDTSQRFTNKTESRLPVRLDCLEIAHARNGVTRREANRRSTRPSIIPVRRRLCMTKVTETPGRYSMPTGKSFDQTLRIA